LKWWRGNGTPNTLPTDQPTMATESSTAWSGTFFLGLVAPPVADIITAPQPLEVIRRIEQRGALGNRPRALGNCGQIFRYAVATGRGERDPTGDLKGALPPVKGFHFAAVTDPKKVAWGTQGNRHPRSTLIARCALRLAPLIFVRPGELRHAEWSDIDLDAAEWRYTVPGWVGSAKSLPEPPAMVGGKAQRSTGRGRLGDSRACQWPCASGKEG